MNREEHPDLAQWLEILSAVLMAIAVVGSAFSAWQATRWGGEQSSLFADAGSLRAQSNRAATVGGQQISYDAIVFAEFAIAFTGDALDGAPPEDTERLADLLIRDEFRPAVEAWLEQDPLNNPEGANTPFDLDEYRNANLEEAEQLEALAVTALDEGKKANQNSDDYILAVVFFASVLFFGGIAPKFRSVYVRSMVLFLATGGLAFALWQIVRLPYH